MIELIGSKNCGRCQMVKTILTNGGVNFQYSILEELPKEKRNEIMAAARLVGQMSFPLIFKNNKIISLEEAKKCN